MLRFRDAWLGAMLLAACLPITAWSAEAKTTFKVRLEVGNVCTLTKMSDVDFGTIAPTGTAQTYSASGTLRLRCTLHTPYTIKLDGGANGTVADRKMRSAGGQTVSYSLYSGTFGQCGNWGAQWGDGTSGTCVFSFTNYSTDQDITVEARTTLATAASGSYTDTVTATITY